MTTKNIVLSHYFESGKYLNETMPALNEDDQQSVKVDNAWKHADFLCNNYILNGLDNILFIVYSSILTAKKLQKFLDKKYNIKQSALRNMQYVYF